MKNAAYQIPRTVVFIGLLLLFASCDPPNEPKDFVPEEYGAITLYTTNSGVSWDVRNVYFQYTSLISADAVFSLASFSYDLQDLVMNVERTGYLRFCIASSDAGKSWTRGVYPLHVEEIPYCCASVDENTAISCSGTNGKDDKGQIYRTSDKGVTWSVVHLSNFTDEYGFWAVDFVNGKTGLVIPNAPHYRTLKSLDGGRSWTEAPPLPTNTYINAFAFANVSSNSVAVACGNSGTILRTTDTCETWTSVPCPVNGAILNSIDFLGSVGVIVGDDGVMLRSTDDGASWSVITHGNTEHLKKVFLKGSAYWAIGDHIILKSLDQGRSWSSVRFNSSEYYKDLVFNEEGKGVVIGVRKK